MGSTKKYSRSKIMVSIDDKLLEEVDKTKELPLHRGKRSSVIESALQQFLKFDLGEE